VAVKELDLAARLGREAQLPTPAVTAVSELSLLAAEREDWPVAEENAGQAVDLIETAGLQEHLFSILGFAAAARVAAHQGNQATARRHAGTVLRMCATPSPAAIPWLSAQVGDPARRDLPRPRRRRRHPPPGGGAQGHLAGLLAEGVLREQLRRTSAGLARE
jgi:hypothetical protein